MDVGPYLSTGGATLFRVAPAFLVYPVCLPGQNAPHQKTRLCHLVASSYSHLDQRFLSVAAINLYSLRTQEETFAGGRARSTLNTSIAVPTPAEAELHSNQTHAYILMRNHRQGP